MKAHKNKPEFWIMLAIAGVIICLSFGQTAKLAEMVGATEWYKQAAFAVLVEILFAASLLIRANQRASGKHVPWFLHVGYFGFLAVVTIINMTVLYQMHPYAGPFVGALISAAMLYTESIFVWINTDADKPHQKSPRELMREAKQEIREMKIRKRIEWMRWEAQKPDLSLIKEARKAEEKRKKVVGDGLPEYFTQKQELEPVIALPAVAEVVPIKRQIGFRLDPELDPEPAQKPKRKSAPRFQPNLEARAKAIQIAKELREELGRMPTKKELMEHGLTEHYSKFAIQMLKTGETE